MYFLSCVDTQVNWIIGMHPFIGISMGWGEGSDYMYRLSVSVCGEWGGVYDLNIESKINLAGNAIRKIYVIDNYKY